MTIPPPFPSQELAKLVLGYLAEEQLMTAYDEFLQASPYLDALQNEYDRMFMTSLKSILADYRAVKIYVETCKPILLRSKIFQCTNLLDVVKLLVNNVDLNKIQEAADKSNLEKQYSVNPNKSNTCESCSSPKLANFDCCKPRTTSNNQSNHGEAMLAQNSIETTCLADLPGNHVTTRKKLMKVLEKDSVIFSDGQSDSGEKESLSDNICGEESQVSHSIQLKTDNSAVSLNSTVKRTDLSDSRKKIEEFDNVLKSVLDKNNTVTGSENKLIQGVSNASTFQDFASGVSGGESQNSNVPDSSTSESMSTQAPLTKDYHMDNAIDQKCQLVLQVSQKNDNIDIQTCRRDKIPKYARIRIKPDDQKVKILSDVKVSNKKKALKNATSTPVTTTPLVQMKTIVINGTQAYNHTPIITQHAYTKDEIMAMPTLIVVPAAGPSKMPKSTPCNPIVTHNLNAANASSTAIPLGPLVIDVPQTPAIPIQPDINAKLSDFNPDPIEAGLVKTVDINKNASVPKDSITCGDSKTPHVLPPVRKSSSTPRRTTHVRVLDFATPRRILHENVIDQVSSQTTDDPAEIVLSSSPNVSFVNTNAAENTLVNSDTAVVHCNDIVQKVDGCEDDTGSSNLAKETNNQNPSNKSNWDADLRAIVAHDSTLGSKITKRKNNSKKKKSHSKTENKRSGSNIISPKIKNVAKKRRNVISEDDNAPSETQLKTDVPVKPTINILSGGDRGTADLQPVVVQDIKESETILNKPDDKDGDCETPDGDRLSLQNVIGARLNISDYLETPYKQALYDIQMSTPRFLSDLPGEPLSDIKISSIPTPRFLDTSKPVQATPSSWSSRPTDYSSGGSYYKPDDQDYMPIADLRCVVSSSSKEDITSDKSIDTLKDDEKKSRPQRQCTKNVSYYRFGSSTNRTKEAEDIIEAASTCSESTNPECKNKEQAVKTPRDRSRSSKSERKRASSKKKKSPAVKEKQKPFVKIKPRQTPTKLTPSKHKKKTDSPGYRSPNKPGRIRIICKTVSSTTPLVVAAPTKSRRKSSTPRKLHCTKSFNSENSNHTSPESTVTANQNAASNTVPHIKDSDTKQKALRWSDDSSQVAKINDLPTTSSANECEDISQIQEYIQTTGTNQAHDNHSHGSFHVDLVKRGFDVETAKIIERDLLDTPPPVSENIAMSQQHPVRTIIKESTLERSIETESSSTNDLQIVQDETEEDEVELSVHECNEGSQNYFAFCYDDTKEMSQEPPIRLKDTFSMNICIDDGVTVRLRATQFSLPLDQEPIGVEEIDYSYNYKETEMAVNSISNMERLYTPLKESFKAQCYEIFDSTLTSLDTPLKSNSPKRADCETTVTEIVLEEERIQKSNNLGLKKRKRSSDSEGSTSEGKKTKYLFTSASIQNIDIESVLTKLHGP